jgi:hypothetical protein
VNDLVQILLGIVVMVLTAVIILFGRAMVEAMIENARRNRR